MTGDNNTNTNTTSSGFDILGFVFGWNMHTYVTIGLLVVVGILSATLYFRSSAF